MSRGVSVTLRDSDGTRGRFEDGVNANITETENGAVRTEVVGEPIRIVCARRQMLAPEA